MKYFSICFFLFLTGCHSFGVTEDEIFIEKLEKRKPVLIRTSYKLNEIEMLEMCDEIESNLLKKDERVYWCGS